MANLTYKYRMYPNATQTKQLDRIFSIGWRVYNDVKHTAELMHERGERFSAYDIRNLICQQRHEHSELKLLPYDTIDDLVRRYEKALKAFWQRGNKGVPHDKKRRDFTGLGYRRGCGISLYPENDKVARLRLMNVDGLIRVQFHRPFPDGWKFKMAVLTVDAGKWYVSFQLEGETIDAPRSTNPAVGIDIGLVHLLALSDGTTIDHPHWFVRTQNKRTRYAQRLDRQRRINNPQNYNADGTNKQDVFIWSSSNQMRAVRKLYNKLASKVKDQRWYFWHTVTDQLTKKYGAIVLEDLDLDFMLKNGHLAKHAHDAGLGMFRQLLEDKARRRGVLIQYVPAAYSSQTCTECGHICPENRPQRDLFRCVSCGHEAHADINAAKVILSRADIGDVQTPSDLSLKT